MIRVYRAGARTCDQPDVCAPDWRVASDIIWLDLIEPTRDEEQAVEKALSLPLPTREEMQELEASSRLYREHGATYLTADILYNGDAEVPATGPVTFVLTKGPLVTIRYCEPRPFVMLADKVDREPNLCGDAKSVFFTLMEAVVDRTSDILNRNAQTAEHLSGLIFGEKKTAGFGKLITQIGRAQTANARIDQSLTGLGRIFAYVALDDRIEAHPEALEHLRSLGRDVQSLSAHAQAVAAQFNFQLSAALGLINIEQSSIIKIFSVAAVAFLPPTLIASIYGMNFDHMPELAWPLGYPLALVAMVVSAILPLLWFKRKGWL